MKFRTSNNDIIEFEPTKQRTVCPICSQSRKKFKDPCVHWDLTTMRGYCHHCGTSFFEYKPYNKKEYVAPEWKNKTDLTDKAVKWFEGRMISQDTLKRMQIYSDTEFMLQFGKEVEVICFPFFVDKNLINIKYRGPQKSFKLNPGSQLIWYNFNAVLEHETIIIVEGEIDCLSLIQCGFDNCISVPNGAKNTSFIDETIKDFEGKKIILATDCDTPGIELRDELIRRFGAENCKTVNFKDCKDANEFHIKYGGLELSEAIENAQDVPIEGNIKADSIRAEIEDLFIHGLQKGKTIGFEEIDKFISWETKRLAIVTGRPGSGKSEYVDFLVTKLNICHGWKAAYFTPENFPLKYHYAKLYEKLIGKRFSKSDSEQIDFDMAYEYIKENFFYILPENDLTIDKVLSNARSYVKTKGIKILVIDPYNKLEYQADRQQTETQYISKFLDKLTMFAKLNDVLVFLVAHPRKLDKGIVPTLYDISGSSHFYNKCDYGFTVHRIFDGNNIMTNDIEIHWQKIKFKNLGEQGVSELRYNYANGRFEKRQAIDYWDNSNWLIKSNINQDAEFDWHEHETAPF